MVLTAPMAQAQQSFRHSRGHFLRNMLPSLSARLVGLLLCVSRASAIADVDERAGNNYAPSCIPPRPAFSSSVSSAIARWPADQRQQALALCPSAAYSMCTLQHFQGPLLPFWIFGFTVLLFLASAVAVALLLQPFDSDNEAEVSLRMHVDEVRWAAAAERDTSTPMTVPATSTTTSASLSTRASDAMFPARSLNALAIDADSFGGWTAPCLPTQGSAVIHQSGREDTYNPRQLTRPQPPQGPMSCLSYASATPASNAGAPAKLRRPPPQSVLTQQQQQHPHSFLPSRAVSEGSSAILRTLRLFEPDNATAAAPSGAAGSSPPTRPLRGGGAVAARPTQVTAPRANEQPPTAQPGWPTQLETPPCIAVDDRPEPALSLWCTAGATGQEPPALEPKAAASRGGSRTHDQVALAAPSFEPYEMLYGDGNSGACGEGAAGVGCSRTLSAYAHDPPDRADSDAEMAPDAFSLLPCTMSEGGAGRWNSYGSEYGAPARPTQMSRPQYQQRAQLQMQMQLRASQQQQQRLRELQHYQRHQQLRCQMRLHHSPSMATAAAAKSPASALTSSRSAGLPNSPGGWMAPTTPQFAPYGTAVPRPPPPQQQQQHQQLFNLPASALQPPAACPAGMLLPARATSIGRGCLVRQMSLLNVTIPEELDEGAGTDLSTAPSLATTAATAVEDSRELQLLSPGGGCSTSVLQPRRESAAGAGRGGGGGGVLSSTSSSSFRGCQSSASTGFEDAFSALVRADDVSVAPASSSSSSAVLRCSSKMLSIGSSTKSASSGRIHVPWLYSPSPYGASASAASAALTAALPSSDVIATVNADIAAAAADAAARAPAQQEPSAGDWSHLFTAGAEALPAARCSAATVAKATAVHTDHASAAAKDNRVDAAAAAATRAAASIAVRGSTARPVSAGAVSGPLGSRRDGGGLQQRPQPEQQNETLMRAVAPDTSLQETDAALALEQTPGGAAICITPVPLYAVADLDATGPQAAAHATATENPCRDHQMYDVFGDEWALGPFTACAAAAAAAATAAAAAVGPSHAAATSPPPLPPPPPPSPPGDAASGGNASASWASEGGSPEQTAPSDWGCIPFYVEGELMNGVSPFGCSVGLQQLQQQQQQEDALRQQVQHSIAVPLEEGSSPCTSALMAFTTAAAPPPSLPSPLQLPDLYDMYDTPLPFLVEGVDGYPALPLPLPPPAPLLRSCSIHADAFTQQLAEAFQSVTDVQMTPKPSGFEYDSSGSGGAFPPPPPLGSLLPPSLPSLHRRTPSCASSPPTARSSPSATASRSSALYTPMAAVAEAEATAAAGVPPLPPPPAGQLLLPPRHPSSALPRGSSTLLRRPPMARPSLQNVAAAALLLPPPQILRPLTSPKSPLQERQDDQYLQPPSSPEDHVIAAAVTRPSPMSPTSPAVEDSSSLATAPSATAIAAIPPHLPHAPPPPVPSPPRDSHCGHAVAFPSTSTCCGVVSCNNVASGAADADADANAVRGSGELSPPWSPGSQASGSADQENQSFDVDAAVAAPTHGSARPSSAGGAAPLAPFTAHIGYCVAQPGPLARSLSTRNRSSFEDRRVAAAMFGGGGGGALPSRSTSLSSSSSITGVRPYSGSFSRGQGAGIGGGGGSAGGNDVGWPQSSLADKKPSSAACGAVLVARGESMKELVWSAAAAPPPPPQHVRAQSPQLRDQVLHWKPSVVTLGAGESAESANSPYTVPTRPGPVGAGGSGLVLRTGAARGGDVGATPQSPSGVGAAASGGARRNGDGDDDDDGDGDVDGRIWPADDPVRCTLAPDGRGCTAVAYGPPLLLGRSAATSLAGALGGSAMPYRPLTEAEVVATAAAAAPLAVRTAGGECDAEASTVAPAAVGVRAIASAGPDAGGGCTGGESPLPGLPPPPPPPPPPATRGQPLQALLYRSRFRTHVASIKVDRHGAAAHAAAGQSLAAAATHAALRLATAVPSPAAAVAYGTPAGSRGRPSSPAAPSTPAAPAVQRSSRRLAATTAAATTAAATAAAFSPTSARAAAVAAPGLAAVPGIPKATPATATAAGVVVGATDGGATTRVQQRIVPGSRVLGYCNAAVVCSVVVHGCLQLVTWCRTAADVAVAGGFDAYGAARTGAPGGCGWRAVWSADGRVSDGAGCGDVVSRPSFAGGLLRALSADQQRGQRGDAAESDGGCGDGGDCCGNGAPPASPPAECSATASVGAVGTSVAAVAAVTEAGDFAFVEPASFIAGQAVQLSLRLNPAALPYGYGTDPLRLCSPVAAEPLLRAVRLLVVTSCGELLLDELVPARPGDLMLRAHLPASVNARPGGVHVFALSHADSSPPSPPAVSPSALLAAGRRSPGELALADGAAGGGDDCPVAGVLLGRATLLAVQDECVVEELAAVYGSCVRHYLNAAATVLPSAVPPAAATRSGASMESAHSADLPYYDALMRLLPLDWRPLAAVAVEGDGAAVADADADTDAEAEAEADADAAAAAAAAAVPAAESAVALSWQQHVQPLLADLDFVLSLYDDCLAAVTSGGVADAATSATGTATAVHDWLSVTDSLLRFCRGQTSPLLAVEGLLGGRMSTVRLRQRQQHQKLEQQQEDHHHQPPQQRQWHCLWDEKQLPTEAASPAVAPPAVPSPAVDCQSARLTSPLVTMRLNPLGCPYGSAVPYCSWNCSSFGTAMSAAAAGAAAGEADGTPTDVTAATQAMGRLPTVLSPVGGNPGRTVTAVSACGVTAIRPTSAPPPYGVIAAGGTLARGSSATVVLNNPTAADLRTSEELPQKPEDGSADVHNGDNYNCFGRGADEGWGVVLGTAAPQAPQQKAVLPRLLALPPPALLALTRLPPGHASDKENTVPASEDAADGSDGVGGGRRMHGSGMTRRRRVAESTGGGGAVAESTDEAFRSPPRRSTLRVSIPDCAVDTSAAPTARPLPVAAMGPVAGLDDGVPRAPRYRHEEPRRQSHVSPAAARRRSATTHGRHRRACSTSGLDEALRRGGGGGRGEEGYDGGGSLRDRDAAEARGGKAVPLQRCPPPGAGAAAATTNDRKGVNGRVWGWSEQVLIATAAAVALVAALVSYYATAYGYLSLV